MLSLSQKRLKGYSSIGYKIKIADEHSITPELIYDGKSFYTVYCQDIKSAHKEVMIVCPFMRKRRISQLSKIFSQAIFNGAEVTVITRPPEDFKESEREAIKENIAILQNCGVNVIYKSDFHQKFIVIDNQIVWYGSVNFLSFGTNEESIMRFVSFDIAGELTDTVM